MFGLSSPEVQMLTEKKVFSKAALILRDANGLFLFNKAFNYSKSHLNKTVGTMIIF